MIKADVGLKATEWSHIFQHLKKWCWTTNINAILKLSLGIDHSLHLTHLYFLYVYSNVLRNELNRNLQIKICHIPKKPSKQLKLLNATPMITWLTWEFLNTYLSLLFFFVCFLNKTYNICNWTYWHSSFVGKYTLCLVLVLDL